MGFCLIGCDGTYRKVFNVGIIVSYLIMVNSSEQ